MTYYSRVAYKIEEAGKQGAAGVLIVHDGDAVGYGWNVVQSTWSGALLHLAGGDGDAGRAAIEGWIQKDAARAMFSAAGLDFAAASAAAARPGFKPMALGCGPMRPCTTPFGNSPPRMSSRRGRAGAAAARR